MGPAEYFNISPLYLYFIFHLFFIFFSGFLNYNLNYNFIPPLL